MRPYIHVCVSRRGGGGVYPPPSFDKCRVWWSPYSREDRRPPTVFWESLCAWTDLTTTTPTPRGRIFGNFHVEVCVFLGGWTTSKKVTSNKEDSDFLGGQTTSNVRIAQRPNKNTGRNRKNWGHYKFTLFYLKHSWKTNAAVCLQLQLVTFLPDLVKVCYSSTENWPWQSSPVQKRCLSHALRNG